MHMKKIISFVIPVLNEEDNISACISEIERLRLKILKNIHNVKSFSIYFQLFFIFFWDRIAPVSWIREYGIVLF